MARQRRPLLTLDRLRLQNAGVVGYGRMGEEVGEEREVAVDREDMTGLIGHKIGVRLMSVEAQGLEVVATLDEVCDGGIVLSEIGELGPGPTLFCPWDSLRLVRDRDLAVAQAAP